MTEIVDFEKFKKKKNKLDKDNIRKTHQYILEDIIRSMLDNGITMNERVEKRNKMIALIRKLKLELGEDI